MTEKSAAACYMAASVRIGEPQKVLDAFGARLSDGGPLALLEGGAE